MTFRRILMVELRKTVDTRASRWIILSIVVLSTTALVTSKVFEVNDFAGFLAGATLPLPALLPILAILATTGDWAQRSAMTTFCLVPQRSRVLRARILASLLVVLMSTVIISALAVVSFLIVMPDKGATIMTAASARQLASMLALSVAAALTGIAAGFLLLNTPLAITVTVLAPFLYDVLIQFPLPTVAPWISMLAFSAFLTAPEWSWTTTEGTGVGFGPALTSFVLFVAVPITAGWLRQLRREAK